MKLNEVMDFSNVTKKFRAWQKARRAKSDKAKRDEDYRRYKDYERIDTNADHYKDLK